MAAMDKPYTVYYHNGFSGRAQPAFMLLDDAGVSYDRLARDECMEASQAVFALPAVKDNATGEVMGQTTAVLMYLGTKLGYSPGAGLDIYAIKIACDIADIWSEGYDACRAGKEKSTEFLGGRGPRFFSVIQATRVQAASAVGQDLATWTYTLGAEPSYVDFLLLNAVLTLQFSFNNLVAPIVEAAGLKPVVDAITARPNVATYLASAEPVLYEAVANVLP